MIFLVSGSMPAVKCKPLVLLHVVVLKPVFEDSNNNFFFSLRKKTAFVVKGLIFSVSHHLRQNHFQLFDIEVQFLV